MKRITLFATLVLLLIGCWLAVDKTSAQPESPLSEFLIDQGEVIPVTGDEEDGLNNVLAQTDGFLEGYRVEGFRTIQVEEDQAASAYVFNGVYRYQSEDQAQKQLETLTEGDLSEAEQVIYDGVAKTGMHTRAMKFIGSEGDAIYWFWGMKGQTLHLLMVNGADISPTQELFEDLMARLLEH